MIFLIKRRNMGEITKIIEKSLWKHATVEASWNTNIQKSLNSYSIRIMFLLKPLHSTYHVTWVLGQLWCMVLSKLKLQSYQWLSHLPYCVGNNKVLCGFLARTWSKPVFCQYRAYQNNFGLITQNYLLK